ncbi:MAG: excalibur calcium-binding domain-containing protein [Thermomicrobiales bacterium]|nr:excalibur calcium-binding domain-containing protein [Thermomicrobiales bacterium]
MRITRIFASIVAVALAASFWLGGVSAQTESATAEDGKPASEAPANSNPAPSVPVGANLTPPVGLAPPVLSSPSGTGQSGTSSVSMAPGTLTSGVANEGPRANRSRGEAPASAPEPTTDETSSGEAAVQTCGDFPTWYDAQLALESSVDPALNASLDPDGDAIACEEEMYP